MNEIPPAGADERTRDRAIIDMIRGRGNFAGRVTLTANVTTTTVLRTNGNSAASVLLFPATANAAAAVATTFVAIATLTATGFVITHASAATTDRTFYYVLLGG